MATLGEDIGPGLHRVTSPDPPARAVAVAAEVGGRLCCSMADLGAVLEDLERVSRLHDEAVEDLIRLARRWAKMSEISERARDRVIAGAGQRLAPGALAVHPDTVRDRARRLVEARAALIGAGRELVAHAAAAPDREAAVVVPAGHAEPDVAARRAEAAAGRLRARRNQALGVVLASFGLALVLLALFLLPLWTVLLAPLAASLWALRHLRLPDGGASGAEEAASLLSEVGAFTDELFGARRAEREHEAERARLDAARSRAEEEVRLAERAWSDLAGPGVDPEEVDAVVRRFDPSIEGAEHLAGEAVGVRAAEAAAARLVERWAERWRAIGLPAPSIADGEATVQALADGRTRAIVLVGEVTALAEEMAEQAPSAPVVVVEGLAARPQSA